MRFFWMTLAAVVSVTLTTSAFAETKLEQPVEGVKKVPLASSLSPSSEKAVVMVRLKGPALAMYANDKSVNKAAAAATLAAEQETFLARCLALPGSIQEVGRVRHVLNAVFLEVERALLPAITEDPAVQRISFVKNYDRNLAETVPYIGAAAAQAAGFDGTGISVAVLDSGIDYTHAKLSGSGDPDEYGANDPAVIEPGSFPTAKVVGGSDFVGGTWPTGPLTPDPDPLDDGIAAGHGTHVADIIGGTNGVAPGASLYAVKVCSSVSTSCSGVAMIQGMDFSADPNGDGNSVDHVDIINMSLGSNYGQPFDDDIALAVENATTIGILTVASAGNGGDRPYVSGTPAAARSALSVAQTQVPSAGLDFMTVTAPAADAGDYIAVFQAWATRATGVIAGPVQYADGAGGNLDGCAPFAAGSLTGQIVMVDRGACFFSDKIRNIQDGGGVIGIIGLIAPGDPFSGGFGGGTPITIPGFMISQTDADILRGGNAVVTFDPANVLPLAGSMVSSSSRGPRNFDSAIKPDIGAPGGSVSAQAGTGVGETPFGGTSGAAPMLSGSAAILLQARVLQHRRPLPFELKALLANTSDEVIAKDFTGVRAEVTRIGSGEVRVDRAIVSPVAAWDDADGTPSLSFGYHAVPGRTVLRKRVRVRNFSSRNRTFDVRSVFRTASDDTGAVEIRTPNRIRVRAFRDRVFTVRIIIESELLPDNGLSSGADGSNPAPLTEAEFEGDLILDDGSNPIHLPWHVLPRKSADVRPYTARLNIRGSGQANVRLRNRGEGEAQNEVFTLLGLSPSAPSGPFGGQSPTPDLRAVGVNTATVAAGDCSADPSFIWRFAINTWEPQTHLVPVNHEVHLDVDRDGIDDYIVASRDFSALTGAAGLDGRQLTLVEDIAAGTVGAFFFAEHAMNTGNTVLTICGEQIGLTGTDVGVTQVNATVRATDFYFGGPGDEIANLTIVPGGEQHVGEVEDIAPGARETLTVTDNGITLGNSPELGVMVITNTDGGAGARGGATPASEAILVTLPNVFLPN